MLHNGKISAMDGLVAESIVLQHPVLYLEIYLVFLLRSGHYIFIAFFHTAVQYFYIKT